MASRIHIVTPCRNAAPTIDQTIASVLSQAGDFELIYHVQDGCSSDGTVERLRGWQGRLENGAFQTFCRRVQFSFASVPDTGMYDAICRAVTTLAPGSPDWIGWINADDFINPGALELLASIDAQEPDLDCHWVTGGFNVAWDNLTVASGTRPVSSDLVAEGLCDGRHWDFVQQEGTFFRGHLWAKVRPEENISKLRLAGDWNLWRLMAKHARLHEVSWPLGTFVRREGQLSQCLFDEYMAEIDSLVPLAKRQEQFLRTRYREIVRDRIDCTYGNRRLEKSSEPLRPHLWQARAVRTERALLDEIMREGLPPSVTDRPGLVAYDADWQYPAATERHAYVRASASLSVVEGVCYLAFPWATLIDHLQTNSDGARKLHRALLALRPLVSGYKAVVTSCQHIYQDKYCDLLKAAGVTHAFWAHATRGMKFLDDDGEIVVRPLPLYPVQSPSQRISVNGIACELLFSFIGAKPNRFYLTDSRALIQQELSGCPRGYVTSRDSWHYERIVYDRQIFGRVSSDAGLVDEGASEDFRKILAASTFTLCPSGTGPNSIRLWEAIHAGSIPVVLADSYQPPGDEKLWEEATVSCAETQAAIRQLPERLAAIEADSDLLASKRRALSQIALLYGPDSFVYDIQLMYLELATRFSVEKPNFAPKAGFFDCVARIRAGIAPPKVMRYFAMQCVTFMLVDLDGFKALCNRKPAIFQAVEHCLECADLGYPMLKQLWPRMRLHELVK
jgi:glycosyltransferase involved in cell wall biosynthesis